jgi:hypothetical protein
MTSKIGYGRKDGVKNPTRRNDSVRIGRIAARETRTRTRYNWRPERHGLARHDDSPDANPAQRAGDRLLLRVSTTDGAEFRFWLTRSFVKKLWAMLLRMVEWDKAVQQQFYASTRQAVLEIQHQGFSQQGDFSKGFEEAARNFPLGEAPVLLASGKGVRRDDGLYVLSLYPAQGRAST